MAGVRWSLAFASLVLLVLGTVPRAHDMERTQVAITFDRDGSFIVDVINDLEWLKLRLEPFARSAAPYAPGAGSRGEAPTTTAAAAPVNLSAMAASFVDRVVLFVDGREVRPTSAEYVPPRPPPFGAAAADEFPSGTYRLRGRMPIDARTLRWYYGLVVDPYPLTIHRADGRTVSETVEGDAWSGTIDLTGQFQARRDVWTWALVGLFVAALGARLATRLWGRSEGAAPAPTR